MKLTAESAVRRLVREVARQELALQVLQGAGLTPQELQALLAAALPDGGPVEEGTGHLAAAVAKVLDGP